jgi:hypothetical protein
MSNTDRVAFTNEAEVIDLVKHPLQLHAKLKLADFPGIQNSLSVGVSALDMLARQMVLTFRAWAVQKRIEPQSTTIYTPATWFQFFKETHFPDFLLKRFPVVYQSRQIEIQGTTFICPHIDADFKTHAQFLNLNQ